MKKSIIILSFLLFIFVFFIYFYFFKDNKYNNKPEINNTLETANFINETKNDVLISDITENITKDEIIETPKEEKAKKIEEQKKITSKANENIPKNENTKPKAEIVTPIPITPIVSESEKSNITEENNIIVNNTTETEVPTTVIQKELKSGYFYNSEESQRMITEFKKITNNDSNFTVKIDSSAKKSNPFWPYKESEISKQVYNISFGYFVVYAEDFYVDDVKQRTVYYITFDD